MFKFFVLFATVAVCRAAPGSFKAAAAATGSAGGEGPITYEDGNIGINIAGFHASAGLGGLLTGDLSKGGLHAEAGTPFGQEAAAGIGGKVDENGNIQTNKYSFSRKGISPKVQDVLKVFGEVTTAKPKS